MDVFWKTDERQEVDLFISIDLGNASWENVHAAIFSVCENVLAMALLSVVVEMELIISSSHT